MNIDNKENEFNKNEFLHYEVNDNEDPFFKGGADLTSEENKKNFLSMGYVYNISIEMQLRNMLSDCKKSIDRFVIKFYEKYPQNPAYDCLRCLSNMRNNGALFIYIDADEEGKEQMESYFIDNFYDNNQEKSR